MNKIDGLNNLIAEALNNGVFPSANYCLVCNEGTFFNSFGYKTLIPEKEENSLDTYYDMASCTKVVCTTTCILKLLEEGKLRLYDEVCKFIPEFIHKDIVIYDLMTHTSGLPASISGCNSIKEKEELLDKVYNCPCTYERRTKIVYSDVGYILLGLIVERISKLPLDEFARINVFEPLEMYDTHFNRFKENPNFDNSRYAATEIRNDSVCNELLRGKVHDEKAYTMEGVAGHAGLFSTVNDISHFIKMILSDGVYNNKQFLSKATIDYLFKVKVREQNGISLEYNQRGLGWIIKDDICSAGDIASDETILHTGFTGTNIFIDRVNKVGFSLLSNRVHPSRNNQLLIPLRSRFGNYVISHFGGRNEY